MSSFVRVVPINLNKSESFGQTKCHRRNMQFYYNLANISEGMISCRK